MPTFSRTNALALIAAGAVKNIVIEESAKKGGFLMMIDTGKIRGPLRSRTGERVFKTADAAINYALGMDIEPVIFVFDEKSKQRRCAKWTGD